MVASPRPDASRTESRLRLFSALFALVVTGPPGSGKTTLLTALQNALADDGISHAVIEVEALSWAHPFPSDDQAFLHLAALRQMYENAGYGLILCGATVTSPAYMDGLLAALRADERLVVRLEADPVVLRRRIVEREPPSWSGLPSLLAATAEISATSRLLPEVEGVFPTMEATPLEIADQVRRMRPHILGRPNFAKPS